MFVGGNRKGGSSSGVGGDKDTAPIAASELLVALAGGKLLEDDFLGQSALSLQAFQMRRVDPFTGIERRYESKDALPWSEAHKMLLPGYMELEHGYVRNPDGTYFVACLTDLGTEVTGDMVDWWFSHCDNTERYQWWHPSDHISCEWDEQYYSVMPEHRPFGHYVEHTHKVVEKVGGVTKRLEIVFQRPSKFFDVSRFAQAGVTACICARIWSHEDGIGLVAIGHLIHMVRQVGARSEMRSRFWLGHVHKTEDPHNVISSSFINWIGNTSLFRFFKLGDKTADALWLHCSQEMNCLRSFLPALYAREIDLTLLRGELPIWL